MMMRTHMLGVIPARWASTRFPGKVLHPLAGRPLLQHVWERCKRCRRLDRVIIATDDERVRAVAEDFGAEVRLTAATHPSGTDRVAEVIQAEPEATHAINVQGDEPLVDPELIDRLAEALSEDAELPMVTAANALRDPATAANPNVVKVVVNASGDALYFSRSLIPYHRNPGEDPPYYRHHGLYGYSRSFLLQFVAWAPSPLERAEQLEQLRALEHGARIRVLMTLGDSIGVDTPEQAEAVGRLLERGAA
ncbi:MAG TPA: 3-deoxy-manno-octulosonate cytidylyltransferase [Verrucomicrobiales bacterium]|nr:3-deoxy-manno-octulosonate cytidylyltransferase [Verrucomicrobiales bacterium]